MSDKKRLDKPKLLKIKRRKLILRLFFCSPFILYILAHLFISNGIGEQVVNRELLKSNEIGLYNKGHALKGATLHHWKEWNKRSDLAVDSFEFIYKMDMGLVIYNRKITMRYWESWKVAQLNTDVEKIQAFWEIFRSCSKNFEEQQASIPWGLIPGTAQSSFRMGDLRGNFISFCRAISSANSSLATLALSNEIATMEHIYLCHEKEYDYAFVKELKPTNTELVAIIDLLKSHSEVENTKSRRMDIGVTYHVEKRK